MALDPDTRDAILRAAREKGIDPSLALAVAERESNFDPNAKSSKTIRGIYQMTGTARAQSGVGDSKDPYTQASGWGTYMQGVKKEMAGPLGRAPTDTESYLGHYFGGVRAGKVLNMDPNTPVQDVFTKQEMAGNPNFARAGTIGQLRTSIMADIDKRRAKFGGQVAAATPDANSQGSPAGLGEPAPAAPAATPPDQTATAAAPPPATGLAALRGMIPTPPSASSILPAPPGAPGSPFAAPPSFASLTGGTDSGSTGGGKSKGTSFDALNKAMAPKDIIDDAKPAAPQTNPLAMSVGNVMPITPGGANMPPPVPGGQPAPVPGAQPQKQDGLQLSAYDQPVA